MTGFVPTRLSIFKLAFSHKSNQSLGRDTGQNNNERLEYLGDAVLGTVVAEYLFKKYPNADEGFLTKMRSKIVKRKSLNYIGDQMGLNVLLNEYNRTRLSSSMLGNAVEALVGAVYLEKGYKPTKRFIVQRVLKNYVDVHELETIDDNYKSQLLEACQKQGKSVGYKLISKYKQDRRDRFQVAVMVGNEQVAMADDYNKKAAEQLASLKALEKLGLLEEGALALETANSGRSEKAVAKSRKAYEGKRRRTEEISEKVEYQPKLKRKDSKAEVRHVADESPATFPSKSPAANLGEAKPISNADPVSPRPVATKAEPRSNKTSSRRSPRPARTTGSYAVKHGVRLAVAAASILDGLSFGESKQASSKSRSKPASNRIKRANQIEPSTEVIDQATQPEARTVSGQSNGKQARVLKGVDTSSSSKAERQTRSVAFREKRALAKTTTPASRPLSHHALRKLIRDASAGLAALELENESAIHKKSSPKRRSKPAADISAPAKKRRAGATKSKALKASTEENGSDWEDTHLVLGDD